MTARRFALLFGPVLTLLGCSSEPAAFVPDELERVAWRVAPGHAENVENILRQLFGTPDDPRLPTEPTRLAELIDLDKLRLAAGVVVSHEVGVTTGLYRRHCARCHGVTGDGRGPTALYQSPYPRNFRLGVFKFTSTPRGVPPTDDDLRATLVRGVPGAAMPSFKLLQETEIAALIDYVKYLAIRGQLEQELIAFAGDELDYDPATGEEGPGLSLDEPLDRELILGDMLGRIVQRWTEVDSQRIVPPTPPTGFPEEWVDRGRVLFEDPKRLGCATCHNQPDTPRSVAERRLMPEDFDIWNGRRFDFQQRTAEFANEVSRRLNEQPTDGLTPSRSAAMLRELRARRRVGDAMLPPVPARPRRLGEQVLRGGADPADLFRHIQQGIDGSPMPSFSRVLSDEEVWSLVAYVMHESSRWAPSHGESP